MGTGQVGPNPGGGGYSGGPGASGWSGRSGYSGFSGSGFSGFSGGGTSGYSGYSGIEAAGGIQSAVVDLTDEQIKALPGGVEGEGFLDLVAAPGEGKAYNILGLRLISNFVTEYGNVAAGSARLIGAVGSIFSFEELTIPARNISGVSGPVTAFLTSATRQVLYLPSKFLITLLSVGVYTPNFITAVALSVIENQPIGLYCSNQDGDFTGGHVDNTLRVIVTYTIDDV